MFKRKKDELTKRELEVLNEMSKGKSNKEIAKDLGIALDTVVNHTRGIFATYEVNNRTAAVVAGIRRGEVANF